MRLDASALDSIDDLLAKGDTNAALLVINMVTNGLNGDSSQVRVYSIFRHTELSLYVDQSNKNLFITLLK